MVIGLDCAAPELIFDRWLDDLPNLKSICRSGLHGVAPLVRSAYHSAGVVGDDVLQESWPAWSLRVSKPCGLFLRPLFHRQLACD